jgi:coenzyme PQQ synthesis protein D (PqqD)
MKSIAVLPRARKSGLVINELEGETLVYDLESDVALCLNQTAALVWKGCDGKTTVAGATGLLVRELHTPVDEDLIWLAMKQLDRLNLIESGAGGSFGAQSISRRDLLLKYAPAALALPVIVSISAPTLAQVASCQGFGGPCSTDGECCSSNCVSGRCDNNLKPQRK